MDCAAIRSALRAARTWTQNPTASAPPASADRDGPWSVSGARRRHPEGVPAYARLLGDVLRNADGHDPGCARSTTQWPWWFKPGAAFRHWLVGRRPKAGAQLFLSVKPAVSPRCVPTANHTGNASVPSTSTLLIPLPKGSAGLGELLQQQTAHARVPESTADSGVITLEVAHPVRLTVASSARGHASRPR